MTECTINKQAMPRIMYNSYKRDKWVIILKSSPQTKLRLFCLPFAGGSSTAFRDWCKYLPASIELCAIEIPGRGHRLSEPLEKKISPLIEGIAAGILPYLDRPFALFGHSMGSLLGFELTHHLIQLYQKHPVHLFLSGRGAPFLASREQPIHALPEPEFIQQIKNYNGTPKEVLEHQELMQLMVPILRADFEICETYEFREKPPLECPLTIFGGLKDNGATRSELEAWQRLTSAPFSLRLFPGDHFYLLESQITLVQTIIRELHKHLTLEPS